jgi:hypothetical protein
VCIFFFREKFFILVEQVMDIASSGISISDDMQNEDIVVLDNVVPRDVNPVEGSRAGSTQISRTAIILEENPNKRKPADELQEANKRIAKLEERETKQDELTTCYICLSKMKWPLQVCETGHFACAHCLCTQSIVSGNIKCSAIKILLEKGKFKRYSALIPKYHVSWKLNFTCGLCKKPANPKYAGPVVTQLIDPKPTLICPTCDKNFSESLIGVHIVQCRHNKIQCPLCLNDCKIKSLNYHIDNVCRKLPCKKCDFESTHKELINHMMQHELVDRSILAIQSMGIISSNIGMKRMRLLLFAMRSLHDVSVGDDRDCTMTNMDELRHFLSDHGF